jgi:hypothetical protein
MKLSLLILSLILFSFPAFTQTNPGDIVQNKVIGNNLGGLGNILAPSVYFGAAVENIGDIDGDGVEEIAAGVHNYG